MTNKEVLETCQDTLGDFCTDLENLMEEHLNKISIMSAGYQIKLIELRKKLKS